MPRTRKPPLSWISPDLHPLAVPLGDVTQDEHNIMGHPEESVGAIVASLRRYGQRKPIVANKLTRRIEAGNGTHEAARRLGWSHIAVVWVEDDPGTATGFQLADNRSSQLALWDEARLAEAIAAVSATELDLSDALLLEKLAAEHATFADTESVVGEETPDAISEESQKLQEFIARRKASMQRGNDKAEVNFWVCLVFQSWLQKQEFLAKIQEVPVLYGMYADGEAFAARVGLAVTPNLQRTLMSPLDKKLQALVLLNQK